MLRRERMKERKMRKENTSMKMKNTNNQLSAKLKAKYPETVIDHSMGRNPSSRTDNNSNQSSYLKS
jgi:hypothetical protein